MLGTNKLGFGWSFLLTGGLAIFLYSQETPQKQTALKTLSGINVQEFEKKQGEKKDWSNNPFVKSATQVSASELKLTGIVFNPQDAAALINDQIVKRGDKIGVIQILDIQKTRVILRSESGLFSLEMKGGK